LAEIERMLAAENQRLPFEPMDHRALLGTQGTPTIGGVVGGNISGSRRIQAGACRDSLIGVRFVDGTGAIVKNGGRVMKNVTGYDLVKLMAGSWGTLGVLTEVSFKLLPDVETSACLVISGLTNAQAVQAMAMAMGTPYEITGAAHLPKGAAGQGVAQTLLRLEGFAQTVAYRAGQLQKHLGDFGAVDVIDDHAQVQSLWRDIRDVAPFHGRDGDVWRVSVKPGDGARLGENIKGEVYFDWAGGLIWALVAKGHDLRADLGHFAGHATRVRGKNTPDSPMLQPDPPPIAALSVKLKHQFDPRGILNPGLMG
jgi:glycolate oxidase FAD binding subunit